MLKLISEANEKYGEYKSLLHTLEFDSKYFLDSVLLNESYKSTQISQDKMYYLKYMEKMDDNREIQNLKHTIEFAYANIREGKEINIGLVNEMYKRILGATFIPPVPEDVPELLINLYDYMNDEFIDPLLVNVAISHVFVILTLIDIFYILNLIIISKGRRKKRREKLWHIVKTVEKKLMTMQLFA